MVEWSITVVLKTTVPRGTGGSNPSLSARLDKVFQCLVNNAPLAQLVEQLTLNQWV